MRISHANEQGFTTSEDSTSTSDHLVTLPSSLSFYCSADQTLTVLSRDPDTILSPSGENAIDSTVPRCPPRGDPTLAPVEASQIRIIMSAEPEAICVLSGEKARHLTGASCPHS